MRASKGTVVTFRACERGASWGWSWRRRAGVRRVAPASTPRSASSFSPPASSSHCAIGSRSARAVTGTRSRVRPRASPSSPRTTKRRALRTLRARPPVSRIVRRPSASGKAARRGFLPIGARRRPRHVPPSATSFKLSAFRSEPEIGRCRVPSPSWALAVWGAGPGSAASAVHMAWAAPPGLGGERPPLPYLFASGKTGKRACAQSVRAALADAAKKAWIKKRVTPHVLRHYAERRIMRSRSKTAEDLPGDLVRKPFFDSA